MVMSCVTVYSPFCHQRSVAKSCDLFHYPSKNSESEEEYLCSAGLVLIPEVKQSVIIAMLMPGIQGVGVQTTWMCSVKCHYIYRRLRCGVQFNAFMA